MSESQNLTIEEYEAINPLALVDFGGHSLVYCTPNQMTQWRVNTLADKEPATVEWISGFKKGAVLIDVGANVGMYTVLAAVVSDARVFAFEPESQNFALLIKNILMNKITAKVRAWPVALSDIQEFSQLYLSDFNIGGSGHSFGESVDFRLQQAKFPYTQGSVSTTLDRLVEDGIVPVPNHIKIDVDGFEHKVLKGSHQTLQDSSLRSLLVELNPALEEHQAVLNSLAKFGFSFDPDQVRQSTRIEGPCKGMAEYVFRR